jgi:hypothetical protein
VGPDSFGAAYPGEPFAVNENVYTLTAEERKWLTELNDELWPPLTLEERRSGKHRIKLEAKRILQWTEFQKVMGIVETHRLLTSMFCTSMFGGYGMDVYEHEPFPGAGPLHVLRLIEDHLPDPHRLQVGEGYDKHIRKTPGVGRDDAWESFSKFTHSDRNTEWLKFYKMDPPRNRSHYDY